MKVLKWVEWVILLYVLSPWSVDDTTLHILQVFFSHLTRGLSSFFLTFSPPPFEFDYNLSLHFTTYDLWLATCDGWILGCHANIGLLGVATYMLLGVIHVSGLWRKGGLREGKEKGKGRGEEDSPEHHRHHEKKLRCVAIPWFIIFGLLDLTCLNGYNKFSIFLSVALSISLLDMHLLYWD